MATTPIASARYIFDIDKLLPGDILLNSIPLDFDDTATWNSHFVQMMTRSRYSGAAIHLAEGLFIEGIGSGVARLPLHNAGIRDSRNVRLLRVRAHHEEIGRRAAARGRSYLQRGYFRPEQSPATCSIFEDLRGGAICSALVANAYQDAAYPLSNAKTSTDTFPGDLLASALLDDITDSVLRRLKIPAAVSFQLDDTTVLNQLHHWSLVTQRKILRNSEVRSILNIRKAKPVSMRELESLIVMNEWRALDNAVYRCLCWYRYAAIYSCKRECLLRADSLLVPSTGVAESLAAVAEHTSLSNGQRLLHAEHAHCKQQQTYYEDLLKIFPSKTFRYLHELYSRQILASEHYLESLPDDYAMQALGRRSQMDCAIASG